MPAIKPKLTCIPGLALALLAALFLLAAAAFAQTPAPPEKRLDQVRLQLDQIQASLTRADQSDLAMQGLRAQLDPLALAVQQVVAELSPKLDAVKVRIDVLKPKTPDKAAIAAAPAPKPAEDKPAVQEKPAAEPDAAAGELADQDKTFKDIDATLRRARALGLEIEQTMDLLQERRHAIFARALFEQSSSLLRPGLWVEVARDIPRDLRAISFIAGDWTAAAGRQLEGWRLPLALGLFAALGALAWPAWRIARRVIAHDGDAGDPGRLRKILAACGTLCVIVALPFAFVAMAAALADVFALDNARVQPFFRALGEAILRIAFAVGISRAILAPGRANWRLMLLSDGRARNVSRALLHVAILLSAAKLLASIADVTAAALPVVVATRGIGAVLVALTLASSLRGLGDVREEAAQPGMRESGAAALIGPARLAVWTVAAAIPVAVATGYVAFASFLADQYFWIVSVGGVLYMAKILAGEAWAAVAEPGAAAGRVLEATFGLRQESLRIIATVLTGATHLLLYALGALLVFAPWGLQSDDLAGSVRSAFFGFSVGDVTISPSRILVAALLFAAVLGIVRAIQRWLDTRLLPLTRLDGGLRNSIATSLGYLGAILATSLALAHLGLSFEKLAIVAGALSVGIGFGLQSIVNNFVSGLILLWERAIRVGDWIVVGADEGYVRRINVRSTEIETFDRLTVIVPNSNLVSGVVKNWVRGDKIGRVKIAIVLGNDADTQKARDILVDCARASDAVLRIPAPQVLFDAIAATQSTLELLCFVDDVETSARIRSDLLFDIHKRFKDAALVGVLPPPPVPVVVNVRGAAVESG